MEDVLDYVKSLGEAVKREAHRATPLKLVKCPPKRGKNSYTSYSGRRLTKGIQEDWEDENFIRHGANNRELQR